MIPLLTIIQIGKAQFNRVDIQFRTENHYVDIQIENQVEGQHKSMMTQLNLDLSRADFYFSNVDKPHQNFWK